MNETSSTAARPVAACPVCAVPKDKCWHLVCQTCWANVPFADQQALYSLYKNKRGSREHRIACLEIVKTLYRERRATAT